MSLAGARVGALCGAYAGYHPRWASGGLFGAVLALAATRPVFNADYVVQDPVSLKCLRIVDWNDASHYLEQTDQTKQCAMPAGHADYANQSCLTFAGTQSYQSNRTAVSWGFRHDGTGGEEFCVFTATGGSVLSALHTTVRNQDASTTSGSFFGFRPSGTLGTFFRCANSTGTNVVLSDVAAGVVIGTPTYIDAYYGESASPQYAVRLKGALVASGARNGAPAGTASSSLVLGKNLISADFFFIGRWRESGFSPVLTAPGRATVQQHLQQAYGLAA